MRILTLAAVACVAAGGASAAPLKTKTPTPAAAKPEATTSAATDAAGLFSPQSAESEGSVVVEGQRVDYRAVAGTLVVHPKGWDDVAEPSAADKPADDKAGSPGKSNPKAEASMFYVAYFKKGVRAADRPITFLYNGGPGSSTVWLHMGCLLYTSRCV